MIKKIILLLVIGGLLSCNSSEKEAKQKNTEEKKVQKAPAKSPELMQSISRGEVIYNDLCITCHMANGKGVPKAFPPLAKSDYLEKKQIESIRSIKYGQKGEIVVNGITYNSVMAPLGLEDDEVADVMNYINNAWGNEYGSYVSKEQVSKIEP